MTAAVAYWVLAAAGVGALGYALGRLDAKWCGPDGRYYHMTHVARLMGERGDGTA